MLTIYYIVVAEVWARMSLKKNFIFASARVKVISRSQFYPLYFEEILPLLTSDLIIMIMVSHKCLILANKFFAQSLF